MTFFFSDTKHQKQKTINQELTIDLLHKYRCKTCPLDKANLCHPKMPASGASKPIILILGESGGKQEDLIGKQFVGKSGQLLRKYLPENPDDFIRWDNITRCSHPDNKTPEWVEIESCRKIIEEDILKTRPKAIFGFGAVPLNWVLGGSRSIQAWRGRRCVARIGGFSTWFYPMLHPSFILHKQKDRNGAAWEKIFERDLNRALEEIDDLPGAKTFGASSVYDGVHVVLEDDIYSVIDFLDELSRLDAPVGFDIETKNLRPYYSDSTILSMSFSTGSRTIAFGYNHPESPWSPANKELLKKELKKFFLDRKCALVVQNLSFEQEWMAYEFGNEILRAGKWEDTQAQAHTLDERTDNHVLSLDSLVLQHLGFNLKSISSINVTNLEKTPLEKVLFYNSLDAKFVVPLFKIQAKSLYQKDLMKVYKSQIRRTPTIVLTQQKGIFVDSKFFDESDKKLAKEISSREDKLYDLDIVREFERRFGHQFNWGSPDDLVKLFNGMLNIPQMKSTKGGKYSVDEDVLSQIQNPIAKDILKLRKFTKVKSTYVENVRAAGKDIYPDNRIHPSYTTMWVRTKRLSANGPNIQNQAKRFGKEYVRPGYSVPPDHTMVSVDYGQIEARVIAMASKDKVFVDALWNDLDIHQEWAEKLARKYPKCLPEEKAGTTPMKQLRDKVKNKWVFPAFFGASQNSIAGYLKLPDNVVKPLFKEFWQTFSGVRDWQKTIIDKYDRLGYVESLDGFRRHEPLEWSEILNTPIQSSAASIVLDAMNRMSELAIETDQWYLQPIMNIHDDLTYEIPNDKLDDALETIITEMVKPTFDFINVPLTIDVSMGPNWFEQSKVGTFASNTWNG